MSAEILKVREHLLVTVEHLVNVLSVQPVMLSLRNRWFEVFSQFRSISGTQIARTNPTTFVVTIRRLCFDLPPELIAVSMDGYLITRIRFVVASGDPCQRLVGKARLHVVAFPATTLPTTTSLGRATLN